MAGIRAWAEWAEWGECAEWAECAEWVEWAEWAEWVAQAPRGLKNQESGAREVGAQGKVGEPGIQPCTFNNWFMNFFC